MRKFLTLILSTICLAFFAVSLPHFLASAENGNSQPAELDVFLPSSALQLFDLKSPVSVDYSSSGFMVITEHIGNTDGTSVYDKISVYNPTVKKFTSLIEHQTIYNVTHAQEHGGYVFYLSNSRLYYVPISNLDSTPVESPITSSNFFHVRGEYLLTNTNNSIVIYKISFENGVEFTKQSTHNFTTKNAFISQEFNIYYLFGGKLYCFDTQSSTSYVVSTVSFDVNYMAESGNYVYLTSSSGLYKIEKGRNSTTQLVMAVNPNSSSLGNLQNPQGLTVMGEDIVIADSDLKCVQAINTTTEQFTDFAITTESTADYRLTNNASHLSLSENYIYALDDGAVDGNGNVFKRIIKVALDKSVPNRYKSFNLKDLYQDNTDLIIKRIACSDTHILIHADKTVTLYDTTSDSLEKVYSIESESVTDLFYLDGEFYYTDYGLLNFGYNAINLNKITLPTPENELQKITKTKVNSNVEIKGIAVDACVDVFGNYYIISNDTENANKIKLIKYSNQIVSTLATIDYAVKSMQVDFAGNVYVLSSDNIIYKYGYIDDAVTVNKFTFDNNFPLKDIALNYKSSTLFALSNACILKTADNTMNIENLTTVSADNVNPTTVTENLFISINKDAKLFKVKIGDYDENNNFKYITPITNPNPNKVYLVISQIDNYYLVSYSEQVVALVRKTNAIYQPNVAYNSAIITSDYYSDFNITITEHNGKEKYISNQTLVFAKPLFDNNYVSTTLNHAEKVYTIKTVTFNGVSMTLVSKDQSLTPCGYVISGYLSDEIISNQGTVNTTISVVDGNGNKHFNNVLMIFIIALTITVISLFIEKKLLFDKESGTTNEE